jgi:lysophospholipase L1-like esterase
MRFHRAVIAAALVSALAGCAATSPEPSESGTRIAFYGDSYTLGTGASTEAARWSSILCAERGWDEFNPSANGLGFINARYEFGDGDLPSLIIADDPDIVMVTLGLNDNFAYAYAADQIQPQIVDDFARLKEGLPDARFIVVEPFWYTDERPESVDIIIGWVEDAAGAIDADYISGASRWIEGRPEWMADDGIHPNDQGYAEIAERMNEELVKLGL